MALNPAPGHDKFIAAPLGYNWMNSTDSSLWSIAAKTNNVCPGGWHVATSDELKMELLSWSHDNITDSFNSTLRWVPTGNRDNHGTERYSNGWAFMWSSTTDGFGGVTGLAIIGNNQSEVLSGGSRIYGQGVRCVKD